MLGGTSGLNYMLYVRGNRADFDGWKQLGNTGWSYDEVTKLRPLGLTNSIVRDLDSMEPKLECQIQSDSKSDDEIRYQLKDDVD